MEAVKTIPYRPACQELSSGDLVLYLVFSHHMYKYSKTVENQAGSLLDVFASLWFPYRERRRRGRSTYKG
jgi:hypothetical protein